MAKEPHIRINVDNGNASLRQKVELGLSQKGEGARILQ